MRMDGQNLTKFCIHIIIDKIYVCIVKGHVLPIDKRVTSLDWCQELIFAQYLENGWTEINQILYTHYHWKGLGWYCKLSFFTISQQSYGPWLMSQIGFCSTSWEWKDRIKPNFVYTLSLTRSMFVMYIDFFCKFATELRPLIDVRNRFLLNILRMDWQNLSKLCKHIIIDKIYVGM